MPPLSRTLRAKILKETAVDSMNPNEVKVKRYSIVALVVLCAAFSGILVMRRATNRMTRELLQITGPTAAVTAAQREVSDVADPRPTLPSQEETTETTTVPTTAATTRPTTTTTTKPTTTTAPAVTQAAAVETQKLVLPLENANVAKEFSPNVPVQSATMQDWRTHGGVDFSAPEGSEVHAVSGGRVTKVIADPRWGYTIEIDHGSFTARYCALSQDGAVGIDRDVRAGEVIGTLAPVPIESADGAHLHFEVLRDGARVDPLEVLAAAD